MKRLFCALMILALICGCAMAEKLFVALSDESGVRYAMPELEVADADGDGAVAIYDALYALHEACCEGGAAASFAAADMGYGLSISMLNGVDNGGAYGYYLNNASAFNLADPVADGDFVHAYLYTDLEGWSDTYCYFDKNQLDAGIGEAITLKLTAVCFDADWNVVLTPVEGAKLVIAGEETDYVTDAEGCVSLSFDAAGSYMISARSETMTLVAPVCIANVA